MVKVITAITTLKKDETIDDVNNIFNVLKTLLDNKPIKTPLLENEQYIKVCAAVLSLRPSSGYSGVRSSKPIPQKPDYTFVFTVYTFIYNNIDPYEKGIIKNIFFEKDDKYINDLQSPSNTDFEIKKELYNLIKTKDKLSLSIDETTYKKIAEIEKEQRKVYDTLLPILTYDYYNFSNNGIYNNSKRGNTPYYNQAEKKRIVISGIFKKYNNTTDDDDDDAALTKQVEKYIELMNKIPEHMCISVKFFRPDKRNPWQWIKDYIDYKNEHKQNVESTYAVYNDKGGCGHQVAITTSDDNPTGIEDTDGEYIVTYKNSHNVKFGREGYDTDILNKNNTENLQIVEFDKKNNSSHQKFKAGITSFELKEIVQEPKNS